MGELHLDIICDRLKREFKVESNVGKPEVAYREAISKKVACEYKYAKQSGGRGQYGHVLMEIEPGRARRRASSSRTTSSAASIPKEFIPAVEKGVREAMERGVLAGYPDRRHEVPPLRRQLPRRRFERAGVRNRGLALLPGRRQAGGLHLLEPIMKNEVVVPEQYMGDVIGDINSRRGQDPRHEPARQRAGHRLRGAARHDVRLRHRPALDDAGPRDVVTALLALRPGPRAVQEEVVAKVKGTSR